MDILVQVVEAGIIQTEKQTNRRKNNTDNIYGNQQNRLTDNLKFQQKDNCNKIDNLTVTDRQTDRQVVEAGTVQTEKQTNRTKNNTDI